MPPHQWLHKVHYPNKVSMDALPLPSKQPRSSKLYLVGMRLRPSIVISLCTWGKAERSEVVDDVHEQTIGCLREMIADGYSLIVSSHNDV